MTGVRVCVSFVPCQGDGGGLPCDSILNTTFATAETWLQMGLVEVDEVAEVVTLTEQGRLTLRALTGAQLVISGAHETAGGFSPDRALSPGTP